MTKKVKFESNTKKLIEQMHRLNREALENIGSFVVEEAVSRTPVVTGTLKEGWTHSADDEKGEVTIGNPVEYSPHVELGIGQRGTPMLRPAVEQNGAEIRAILEKLYRDRGLMKE